MPQLKMKRLYVGCGISTLPPEVAERFLKSVADVKDKLRENFIVLDFLGTGAATPKEVYRRDIVECVGTADAMLAICDYPSTGLGYEMCAALQVYDIPVLGMSAYTSNVSRLIVGIHGEDKPLKYNFVHYPSFDDIPKIVAEQFKIRDLLAIG